MKAILVTQFILILSFSYIRAFSDQLIGCALYINNNFYDMKNLSNQETDYKVNVESNYMFNFNLCNQLNNPCSKSSPGYALLNNTNTSDCRIVATGYDKDSFSLMNDSFNNLQQMLQINYQNYTTTCADNPLLNYSILINLHCNSTLYEPKITGLKYGCVINIDYISANACAKLSIGILWEILERDKIAVALIMIILGAGIAFFGQRLFKPTIFLLATIGVGFIILILIYEFVISPSSPTWIFYILLGISLVVGGICGYLLFKFTKYGIFLLGAWLGFVIIMILWSLILHQICNSNQIALIIFLVIGILSVAIASFYYRRQVILIATSYVGSYLCIKGLGVLIGGFPNEFTLYQQIKNGNLSTWTATVYIYLIVILALGTFAMIYQEKNRKKDNNLDGDDDDSEESPEEFELKSKSKYKKHRSEKKK